MMKKTTQRKSGVVLPSVLALILCGVAIVSALVIHATRSMLLTRRSIDYQRASYLALAGLDAGTAFMKQAVYKTRNWGDYDIATVPQPDALIPDYDDEYETFIRYKDFAVDDEEHSGDGTLNSGSHLIVVYSASRNKENGIYSVMTNALLVTFSHLGDYAAFYTRDLEAWPGENMTFKGKVHTNGDLYIGADKLLKFEELVTASGKFYAMRKPDSGYGNSAYVTATGRVQFNTSKKGETAHYADVIGNWGGGQNRRLDSSVGNEWAAVSDNYYNKKVKTDQNVLTPPISVNDDEHVIIERAMAANEAGYNKETEAAKFASKAALTIRFDIDGNIHLYSGKYIKGDDSNEITYKENGEPLMLPASSVSKASQTTGKYNVTQGVYAYTDVNGHTHSKSVPAYEVARYGADGEEGHYMYDRRENKPMALADIYVDQILNDPTLRSYLYPSTSGAGGTSGSTGGSGGSPSASTDSEDEREDGVLYVTYDKYEKDANGNVLDTIGYPDIRTEQRHTGRYEMTGTDTRTTTSETEKNNLVAQGYTVATTTTVTKYYYNNREISKSQYDQYYSNSRYRRYLSTKTTTTWTLTKAIQEEIMETVSVTNYIPVEPAVRLRNAMDLSIAGSDDRPGLSIITDLPMYVEGCFNTNGEKGNANDSCANKPAALVAADAVTMLSAKWDDNTAHRRPNWDGWDNSNPTSVNPGENLNSRPAVETTFNGILMTGIVESNNGTYSGGLQNLFRFHENWRPSGTIPYNFNGSMVCMWTSNIANKPIEASYTYQPPSRPWGWAQMDPPGLPNLTHLQEIGSGRLDSPHDDLPDAIRNVFPDN